MAPSHVLVPLDGSPLAAEALDYALETFDCRVTVLNVVPHLDGEMSEGRILDAELPREESALVAANPTFERARERASELDREVETVVESGDPADTTVEYVETHDVDQVVIGGHGGQRSDLARRLMGTVAASVVGEAPVTVTVVR